MYGCIREAEQGRWLTRTYACTLKSHGMDGANATLVACDGCSKSHVSQNAATDGLHVSQNAAIEMVTRDELTLSSFRAPKSMLSSESDTLLKGEYTGELELVLRCLNGNLTTSSLADGLELDAGCLSEGNFTVSHQEATTQLVLRCLDSDSAESCDWMMVLSGASHGAHKVMSGQNSMCSSSPSWYNLCGDEDQLRPLPTGWEINKTFIPILPHVGDNDNTSLLDKFWWDYETSVSEHKDDDMQEVIAASFASAQEEALQCEMAERGGDMSAMAVIVEIQEKPMQVKPEGLDGCFTWQQKVKTVPWTSE